MGEGTLQSTSRVLLLINVSESVYFSIKSLVWRWQVSLL